MFEEEKKRDIDLTSWVRGFLIGWMIGLSGMLIVGITWVLVEVFA